MPTKNIFLFVTALMLFCFASGQNPYFPGGVPVITATPPAPWTPGQTVTYSITVDNFDDAPGGVSQYFHGLGIILGPCWTNLVYGTPPPNITPGLWIVDLTPPLPPSGPAIPGFYFDEDLDGDPSNNWGDGMANGPWTFTWTVQVPLNPTLPCDLSMGVQVFGDGETGSWTQIPVNAPQTVIVGPGDTIPLPDSISVPDSACANSPVPISLVRTFNLANTYTWDFSNGTIVSGSGVGPYTINWTTTGWDSVKLTIISGTDTVVLVDSIYISGSNVDAGPDFSFCNMTSCYQMQATSSNPIGCSYSWSPVTGLDNPFILNPCATPLQTTVYTLTAICDGCTTTSSMTIFADPQIAVQNTCVNSNTVVGYCGPINPLNAYIWNFGNGTILNGSGVGPYEIAWASSGLDTISVLIINGADTTIIDTTIFIFPQPIADAGSDFIMCAGNSCQTIQSSVSVNSGCTYSWFPPIGLDDPTKLQPCASPLTNTTYYLTAYCNGCTSLVDSITIDTYPQPIASAASNTVDFCFGQGGVNLNGSISGGTGPLTFEWVPNSFLSNPFSLNPVANPTVTTTYSLYVTDSLGCVSDSFDVLVRVNPIPVVDAGRDKILCKNNTTGVVLNGASINPPGNYTYAWSPSTGLNDSTLAAPTASPLVTTIYTLTVRDNVSGCTNVVSTLDTTATLTVYVQDLPIANAGPDKTICEGHSVQIGDVPSGGIGTYSYRWFPTNGLSDPNVRMPIATPSVTTTYSLVVGANGCNSVVDEVTVTVAPLPVANAGADVSICPYDSVQLNATVSNMSGPFSYRWVPAAGLSDSTLQNPFANPDITTTYSLYVYKDSCESLADQITVTILDVPLVDANTGNDPYNLIICNGDSVTIPASITGSAPFNFIWTPAIGLNDPTLLQPIAKPTETTKYYLTATMGACTIVDSAVVTVVPAINPQINIDSTTICQGDTVFLSATGGIGAATFTWSPSIGLNTTTGQNVIATPSQTTTYFVEVTEGGCTKIDAVVVNVNPQPISDYSINTDKGCKPLVISFVDNSFQAVNWVWIFGDDSISNDQNPVHVFDTTGSFIVKMYAYGINGCVDSSQQVITVYEPTIANFNSQPSPLSGDTLYLPNANVQFTDSSLNAISWFWSFGDGSTSTDQNPNYEYLIPGDYTVSLITKDLGGCLDTITKTTYYVREPFVIVPNIFTPNDDDINDLLYTRYRGSESYSLVIFDRFGKSVFGSSDPKEGWDGKSSSGAKCPEGTYFYILKIGDRKIDGNVSILR